MPEVQKFLKTFHSEHYLVYNLCSERSYSLNKFQRVIRIPFEDHNPAKIEQMEAFCVSAQRFLNEDPNNVIAVHW